MKQIKKLSYILWLRKALKRKYKHMPLFQNGSAIIVENEKGEILLQERNDRDKWGLPGGLQELGETFEEVAKRELKEETGLEVQIADLILIDIVSGESRKNVYPNGDQVYNNTALYLVKRYKGELNCDYKEIISSNGRYQIQKESKQLKFFCKKELPNNLMDQDLIERFLRKQK